MNFQYNNRKVRLVKDILFLALAIWLLTRPSIWAILIGALFAFWYGRDAYYQAKVLWQEKHYVPQGEKTTTSAPSEGGKITVSTNAKEVDFEKE